MLFQRIEIICGKRSMPLINYVPMQRLNLGILARVRKIIRVQSQPSLSGLRQSRLINRIFDLRSCPYRLFLGSFLDLSLAVLKFGKVGFRPR